MATSDKDWPGEKPGKDRLGRLRLDIQSVQTWYRREECPRRGLLGATIFLLRLLISEVTAYTAVILSYSNETCTLRDCFRLTLSIIYNGFRRKGNSQQLCNTTDSFGSPRIS